MIHVMILGQPKLHFDRFFNSAHFHSGQSADPVL
jgi:hypothetical protein